MQSKINGIYNILFLICLLVFSACHNKGEFKEVSKHAQLKIISFTTESNPITAGDLIEFKSIYLLNNKDTLLADSAQFNELFNDTITYNLNDESDLVQVLAQLQQGDSCVTKFYNSAQLSRRIKIIKKLANTDTIFAYIKIKQVYKGKDKAAYRLEENAIARYITFSKQEWQATENGIFYRIIKASAHEKLKFNDPIKLVYKGYFLNQQVFDNYAEINPFFEHQVGTQNQLIRGMELALKYISYGAEAEFIFPSSLAFGQQGSSTGIVPAYKPVLYKVKIIDKEALPL